MPLEHRTAEPQSNVHWFPAMGLRRPSAIRVGQGLSDLLYFADSADSAIQRQPLRISVTFSFGKSLSDWMAMM